MTKNLSCPTVLRNSASIVSSGSDQIKAALVIERHWCCSIPAALQEVVSRHPRLGLADRPRDSPSEHRCSFSLATSVPGSPLWLRRSRSEVAVDRGINVSVLRLSLRSRGTGAVGEMTQLLGDAFDEVVTRSRNLRNGDAIVVIIDEADAIAQSRELGQMHHEDRAGVNALIRGIDAVAAERRPVLVLMCTNRLSALDPAVRRRAAAEFEFTRPGDAQRLEMFDAEGLAGCGLEPELNWRSSLI